MSTYVKHYTGRKYEIIGEAQYTDDKSRVIVYKSCINNKLYVMKKSEFFGTIKKKGKDIFRFIEVKDS